MERPRKKYRSAIFTKPDLEIISTGCTEENDREILTVDISVISVYKLPNITFKFMKSGTGSTKIIIGDFNSNSTTWEYSKNNDGGEVVGLGRNQLLEFSSRS